MFASARIKLTLWYVAIITLICVSLSTVFFIQTSRILTREYHRLDQRIQLELEELPFSRPRRFLVRRILPEDLDTAKQRIKTQLIGINVIIITFSSIFAYILSGKTLAPIKKSHEEQKRFIGDAAHELRTPITALRTSLEVNLLDKSVDKETCQILQENLAEVTRLEELTERLLQLSEVDTKQLHHQSVELQTVLTKAIQTVRPLARKSKVTIEIKSNLQSEEVWGDKDKLLDLFQILLDNAIKYSPSSSTITIIAKADKKHLQVSIHDQGYGIAATDLPHIFDRFYRGDPARSKQKKGGHGLGLSLAKKIVDQHEGSISVQSQEDKGTTFTVRFPLHKS